MSHRPLGVGVIGAGNIVKRHALAYRSLPESARLVAIADIDVKRAEAARNRFGFDEAFDDYGIDRRNRRRTEIEHQAQSQRRAQPVRNNRVDHQQPMFQHNAPRGFGNGGGAIDPITGCAALVLSGMGLAEFRRRKLRVAAKGRESCS